MPNSDSGRGRVRRISLRKVARRAGVSHAAPYAHFADKQTLIAANAADGHRQNLCSSYRRYGNDAGDTIAFPSCCLAMSIWSGFSRHYRVTFSGVIQDEHSIRNLWNFPRRNLISSKRLWNNADLREFSLRMGWMRTCRQPCCGDDSRTGLVNDSGQCRADCSAKTRLKHRHCHAASDRARTISEEMLK